MRFSLISAIATLGSVVIAQPVARDLTDQQTIDGLKLLTSKVQALQVPALNISADNAHLFMEQGPWHSIIQGHADINATGSALSSQLNGTEPYNTEQCSAVFDSYKEFVGANLVYLYILTKKEEEGVVDKEPQAGRAVAISLQAVETAYKAIADPLIEICISAPMSAEFASQAQSLANTLGATMQKYQRGIGP